MPNNSAIFQAPCPKNSFLYNKTLCACAPGYLFDSSIKSCSFFSVSPWELWENSSVKHTNVDDNYKKAVKYQVYYVEISIIALLAWLLLCAIVRFGKLGDGRNAWFQIRWWISRLDFTFSAKHWLADQKVVKKRKTELGGAFTIASWILFIGLLVALLYQIIATLGVEVYSMKPTNAVDFANYTNDIELNITTISSMTCSQLHGPKTMVIGSPGTIDYSIVPLSNFVRYSCHNSTIGPVVSLRCHNCPLTFEQVYISWHFSDIRDKYPAMAVGFHFNFTAKNRVGDKVYANFISGTLKNGMKLDHTNITYRGTNTHVLKFNLFPRVHLNLDGLQLLQPSFHEFRPGSSARDEDKLRSLLESPNDGLINTTLALRFFSEYLIEIDDKKYGGPVSFLADIGGLYCISITFFLLVLSLCEFRFKKLRIEDQVMQNIVKRRNAEDRWNKVRKYVAYTYGCRLLDEDYNRNEESSCCNLGGNGLSTSRIMQREIDIKSFNFRRQPQHACEKVLKDPSRITRGLQSINVFPQESLMPKDDYIAPPPNLDHMKDGSRMDVLVLQRELQNLYEYNAMLRDKLISAQTRLTSLTTQTSLTKENRDVDFQYAKLFEA